MSWKSAGSMIFLRDRINIQAQLIMLFNQVHPVLGVQFLEGNAIFQDDKASINTDKIVTECLDDHSEEVKHLI